MLYLNGYNVNPVYKADGSIDTVATQLKEILNAPEKEKKLKELYNDDNTIYHFYDRNKSMRIRKATADGKAEGTCVEDTINNYADTFEMGYDPVIHQSIFHQFGGIAQQCFHQYLKITINGVTYYEDKSNGCHMRFPYQQWFNTHHKQIIATAIVDNKKFLKAIKAGATKKIYKILRTSRLKKSQMRQNLKL